MHDIVCHGAVLEFAVDAVCVVVCADFCAGKNGIHSQAGVG